MIRLIRSDGQEILLNVDLIRSVIAGDGTVITLTTGETLTVKNTPADIAIKVRAFQQGLSDERKAYDDALRPKRTPRENPAAGEKRKSEAPAAPPAGDPNPPEETP